MPFNRTVGWREWFRQVFLRQGLFSLPNMPRTQAEEELAAEKKPLPKDMTRLNIDAHRKD